MKKLIPKYLSPSSTLPEREYLPEYEYEFGIVDNLPNKPKNLQFKPQVYAEKHKRITNELDWQNYWGNQGAASVSNAMNLAGLKLMPYALGLANPLAFASGMIGGEVFDDGTRAASNGKYQDWGSMISDKTGMNPIVSQMTNPGYLVGGAMGESIRFSPTTGMNYFLEFGNSVKNIQRTLLNPDVILALKDFRSGAFKNYNVKNTAKKVFGIEDEFDGMTFYDKKDVISYGKNNISTSSYGVGFGGEGSTKGLNLGGAEKAVVRNPNAVSNLKLLMENMPSGTSFSGDAHSSTLGSLLIDDFLHFKLKDFFNHLTTNSSRSIKTGFYDGMSPDAMAMLYRMAKENPNKFHISYATTPAGEFNKLAKVGGRNYHIYEAQLNYKTGNISSLLYIDILNKWLEPLNGRSAKLVNGEPYIYLPYLVRNKQGGKLLD